MVRPRHIDNSEPAHCAMGAARADWTKLASYMLYVGHCEPDLYSWCIRVAAIVLLLWLLSRSAQAVLERHVPSVYTSLQYPNMLLTIGCTLPVSSCEAERSFQG